MSSLLYPILSKKVNDVIQQLIVDQVTPWVFLHTGHPLKVKRFDGRIISYQGILFEGSPQEVFWNGYIEPFLENICLVQIESAVALAKARELEVSAVLADLRTVLLSGIQRVYNEMASVDRRLRGKGYPQNVSLRNIDTKLERMRLFLDGIIKAETATYERRGGSRKWFARHWRFVVTSVIAIAGIVVGAVWSNRKNDVQNISGDWVAGNKTVIGQQMNVQAIMDKASNVDVVKLKLKRAFQDFDLLIAEISSEHMAQSKQIASEFASRNTLRSGIFLRAQMDLSLSTKKRLDAEYENLRRRIEDIIADSMGKTSLEAAGSEFNEFVTLLDGAKDKYRGIFKNLNDTPRSWEVKISGEIRTTKDFDVDR